MSINHKNDKIIIISISSDIGTAMAKLYLKRGWQVFGTYRHKSAAVGSLIKAGARVVKCDLANNRSIDNACRALGRYCSHWDVLILAPGSQEPIGAFPNVDINKWESSIKVNFSAQLRIVHNLLQKRKKQKDIGPCVLFFAGGGTNNATINYSAYTVSKIALIKMCELLDAEMADTRFVIVGPGWVRTKIHNTTLKAGKLAGANYQRTVRKLAGNDCTKMSTVIDCCDWILSAPKRIVSGRNFSVVHDKWGSKTLNRALANNPNLYKLRRYGNELKGR